MRSMKTSVGIILFERVILTMALVFFASTIASTSIAKTDKYQRQSTTTPDPNAAANPAPSASPSPDKKVDISDLENRYWTAKDTEFNVVQNRLYTKAKRFSVTLQGGTNLSDTYTSNY